MFDFDFLYALIVAKFPIAVFVLAAVGMLIVLAQAIVVLTPSQADDAAWEKIKAIPFLGSFIAWAASKAPIQKK